MIDKIKFFKLDPDAIIPKRHLSTDCGIDIFSIEDIFIPVGKTRIIKTGTALEIPIGFVGKIEDRSGMGAKGLRTSAGVIDSLYSGPLDVVMHNISCIKDYEIIPKLINGKKIYNKKNKILGYQVIKGDRVAQLLVYKIETPEIEEVDTLWTSERGDKGFNSSGA